MLCPVLENRALISWAWGWLFAILTFCVAIVSLGVRVRAQTASLTVEVKYEEDPLASAEGNGYLERDDTPPTSKEEAIRRGILTIAHLTQGDYALTISPKSNQFDAYMVVGIVIGQQDVDLGQIVLGRKANLTPIAVHGHIYDVKNHQIKREPKITFPNCVNSTTTTSKKDGSFQVSGLRCRDYSFQISASGYTEVGARILQDRGSAFFIRAMLTPPTTAISDIQSESGPNFSTDSPPDTKEVISRASFDFEGKTNQVSYKDSTVLPRLRKGEKVSVVAPSEPGKPLDIENIHKEAEGYSQ